MAAHASQFDVNNAASAGFNRGPRVFKIVDALIEANGGLELALKLDVGVNVVAPERLFNHDEIKRVQLLQVFGIAKGVRGICIHHQPDAGKALTEGPNGFDVPARLDFNFDALVAGGK